MASLQRYSPLNKLRETEPLVALLSSHCGLTALKTYLYNMEICSVLHLWEAGQKELNTFSYFVSNASLCVCIIFLTPTGMQYKILIWHIAHNGLIFFLCKVFLLTHATKYSGPVQITPSPVPQIWLTAYQKSHESLLHNLNFMIQNYTRKIRL